MIEFFLTFSFVLIPFLVMISFAFIIPSAGSALYIRNEIMFAVALPPLSAAALVSGVALGLSTNNNIPFLFSFIVTFAVLLILGTLKISQIKRQILLASLFAGGTALTNLLMSISSKAHASLGFLISGELLSLGKTELIQSIFICTATIVMLILFKNSVYSYCIDSELMELRTIHFTKFSIVYRLCLTLIVSASVYFIGPLLTSSLLIFPPLFSDSGKNSITSFFMYGTITGLSGVVCGFITGVALDIPPAYTCAIGILFLGLFIKTIFYFKGFLYELVK